MRSSSPATNAKLRAALASRVTLVALVAFGLWSGGRLSWSHYQSGEACPIVAELVPACYVAVGGYILIAIAVAARLVAPAFTLNRTFWVGLSVAAGLALIGSATEVVVGNVCPRAFGWLPMCYVSLAFSVAIGLLYRRTRGPSPSDDCAE